MAIEDWERTTDIATVQLFEFMKFLADNDLFDKAVELLEEKGFGQMRISVQHMRVVQEWLQSSEHAASTGGTAVVLSAHVDGVCK